MFAKSATQHCRTIRLVLLLVGSVFLSACASTVMVTGKVPEPLVERVPLTVQLNYTDDFKQYIYEEKEKGRGLRSIAFGEAQMALFDGIFSRMLNTVGLDESAFDLRITPSFLDFQYSAPRETKLNLYEIWLKYRVYITDSNDREVADWLIKGYGKTPTAMLSSRSNAFDMATNVALRDVGAQLTIGFKTQPEIADYLKRRKKTKLSKANIENPSAVPEKVTPEEATPESTEETESERQSGWRIK